MKKILLLLIPILLLTGCSYAITKKNSQNPQTQTNNFQLATNNLELQTKCADMAKKSFDENYKDGDGFLYTYQNHFNTKLGKCFILINSYKATDDNLFIDLFDAVEKKHYASFFGHSMCNLAALAATGGNLKKCQMDSGSIWLDGNDTRNPADYGVGFNGLMNGGIGDENTQKQFIDKIQPFMND